MKTILHATFVILMATCTLGAHATEGKSWWEDTPWVDPDRGFNWYPPDAPPPQKPAKPESDKTLSKQARKPRPLKELSSVAELKEELEWRKAEAVWRPTQETLYAYLEAQKFSMDKSALFADVWRRTIWGAGELSYADKTAVINAQANNDAEFKTERRMSTIRDLSRDYSILFFYKNDCRYCHDQAPILKLFQKSYGMEVMPISMDGSVGKMVQLFPNSKPDNGISMVVTGGAGVNRWPVLYVVSKTTRQATSLGTGVMDAESIAERIRVLVTTRPGEEL